jgi:hypothetical protein
MSKIENEIDDCIAKILNEGNVYYFLYRFDLFDADLLNQCENLRKIVIQSLNNGCKFSTQVQGYTHGFECYNKKGEEIKNHYHLHVLLSGNINNKESWKKKLQRTIRTQLENVYPYTKKKDFWMKGRYATTLLSQEDALEKYTDSTRIFQYPLKQYFQIKTKEINEKLKEMNKNPISTISLDNLILKATTEFSLIVQKHKEIQKKMEESGQNIFYEQMCKYIEKTKEKEISLIYERIIEFYVSKKRPFNYNTAEHYLLLYCFSNNIVDKKVFVKNRLNKIAGI